MLSHRIVPLGAVLFAVTIGSAAAQEQSAGKPLQLLQFARHEAKAPLHPHARTVEKLAAHAEVKRHIAKNTAAKHHKLFAAIHSHAVHPNRVAQAAPAPAAVPAPQTAQPAAAVPQPAIWPAVTAGTPGGVAVAAPPAAAQNVKTEPVISDTSAVVTDDKVVQTAAPPPPPPAASAPAVTVDPHPAASPPASNKTAVAEPAVQAMIVRPAAVDSDGKNPIGSKPWLLQVLAALGGALAAGVVAWFLILRGRSQPREEEFFAGSPAPGE